MASPWINTFQTTPALNQDVYIRVPYYYGAPVVARYKTDGNTFRQLSQFWVANTQAKAIPFFMVPRWKPYP